MRNYSSTHEKAPAIDSPLNSVALIGMSIFFWAAGYAESLGFPIKANADSTPLWNLVAASLGNKTGAYLIGLLLLAAGSFLIHRANYMLILIREKTYMPFLLYLIFISSNTIFLPLNSASLGIFCLILAFYQILKTYRDPNAITNTYNAALLIGAGSLLWIHILWFVPVFWWGMYTFKSINTRMFLASLAGLATIYWLLLGWCVWIRDFDALTGPFHSLAQISRPQFVNIRPADWMYMLCLLLLAGSSIVHIFIHEYDDSLRTRQFLFFTIIFGLLSFVLALAYERQRVEYLGVSCMPLAIAGSHFFITSKMKKMRLVYYVFLVVYLLLSVIRSPWNFLPPDVL
jgi:hypothetical protein